MLAKSIAGSRPKMKETGLLIPSGTQTVEHGVNSGEVAALGDIGMFISQSGAPSNGSFWENLAQYAASR